MAKKRRIISVEIDDEMDQMIKDRIAYLQSKRHGSKVTVSDAVRHALSYTSYRRGTKGKGKLDDEE